MSWRLRSCLICTPIAAAMESGLSTRGAVDPVARSATAAPGLSARLAMPGILPRDRQARKSSRLRAELASRFEQEIVNVGRERARAFDLEARGGVDLGQDDVGLAQQCARRSTD